MKKKKSNFVDDGHTVYDMSGVRDGIFSRSKKEKSNLSKKERRAAMKAAFAVYLPRFLAVLCCFGIAILLIFLWLN